jgi:hypothetical protein
MSLIVAGVVGAVGLGISAYGASVQSGLAGQASGIASQQAGEQGWYNTQLQQLIQNPSSFLSSPIFQSALKQGGTSVATEMTAQGFGGSGNEAAALQQYGESTALGGLQSQESILAGLTGLGFNPASGVTAASGAQATGASELSGGLNNAALFAILSQNGGFGGSGGSPNAAGGWP